MDRGLREQSFACTASDRLIRLRSRDVSSTASKTLQTSVIAFSVYFRSEAPFLIPRPTSIGAMHRMGVETSLLFQYFQIQPLQPNHLTPSLSSLFVCYLCTYKFLPWLYMAYCLCQSCSSMTTLWRPYGIGKEGNTADW